MLCCAVLRAALCCTACCEPCCEPCGGFLAPPCHDVRFCLQVAYDRVRAHIKNDDLSCSMAVRQVVASLEDTLTTQRRFSFFYSSYRKSRYWFEIFTMLRKSAIVMAEVLLSTAQWQVTSPVLPPLMCGRGADAFALLCLPESIRGGPVLDRVCVVRQRAVEPVPVPCRRAAEDACIRGLGHQASITRRRLLRWRWQ